MSYLLPARGGLVLAMSPKMGAGPVSDSWLGGRKVRTELPHRTTNVFILINLGHTAEFGTIVT